VEISGESHGLPFGTLPDDWHLPPVEEVPPEAALPKPVAAPGAKRRRKARNASSNRAGKKPKKKRTDRLAINGYMRLPTGEIVAIEGPPPPPPPIKPGKKKENVVRMSPSTRRGARFKPVAVTEEAHAKLGEIARFRKQSRLSVLTELISACYDEVYKQAELLARIEARRQQDEERIQNAKTQVQDRTNTARRNHF